MCNTLDFSKSNHQDLMRDTAFQTQHSKIEHWRSEAEHATSRSRIFKTCTLSGLQIILVAYYYDILLKTISRIFTCGVSQMMKL